MSGGFWIASYVILYVAVIAALVVGLGVATQLGRVMVGGSSGVDDTERRLLVGDVIPDIVLSSGSDEVRIRQCEAAAILQVAVMNGESVTQIETLMSSVDPITGWLIISAIGPELLISRLADAARSRPQTIVWHDGEGQVSRMLGTDRRPILLVCQEGVVRSESSFIDPLAVLEMLSGSHAFATRER